MIDASQWAKQLREQLKEGIANDPSIGTGFLYRAEDLFRKAQLDTLNQCMRLAHQLMNGAPRNQRIGMGLVVDKIADLAIEVKYRPNQAGG